MANTFGHGIDRPLSVVRMGYSDFAMQPYESTWRPHLAPFAILPLWDAHGNIDGAVVSVGGVVNGGRSRCEMWSNKLHCIKIDWPESFFAYERPRYQRWHWHGTLLEDKRNETGTYYRRNRTYDPSSGRFTQEDPIGLAGGLNVYGFAGGDPVSYSDPYGLCKRKDEICRRFVIELRALHRETGNGDFGSAADILDATTNRVVFVDPTDRRLDPEGLNSDGNPATGSNGATATGCGFLGMSRCVYLRNDMGRGDQIATVAHEANYHVRYGLAMRDSRAVTDGYAFDLSIQRSLPERYQPTSGYNKRRLRSLGFRL